MTQKNPMFLKLLLEDIIPISIKTDAVVVDVAADSRLISPHALFLALPGREFDGRLFMGDAIAKGASVILYDDQDLPEEAYRALRKKPKDVLAFGVPMLAKVAPEIIARFFGLPAHQMTITAVTGTNGKTSCTCMLAQCLDRLQQHAAIMGSLGAGRMGALSKDRSLTTPDMVTFQRNLASFRDQGMQHVVFEASSHGIDQKRFGYGDVTPIDVAVFTNLTQDHLDYHGDMANYANVKAQLFLREQLRSAVINLDDPWGQSFAAQTHAKQVIGYGCQDLNTKVSQKIQAQNIESKIGYLSFDLVSSWGKGRVETALSGRFQVYNVMAVIGSLLALGISWRKALEVVQDLEDVNGRMNVFGGGDQPFVIVDYAHSEHALATVLQSMRDWCQGKLWCIMGCGGNRDQGKRKNMGQVAEQYSDQLVLTDDNPRDEDPEAIIADIKSGLLCPWAAMVEHDRATAIQTTIAQAAPGDMILVAGKGAEKTSVFGDQVIAYSDIEQVKQILGGVHAISH